MMLNFDRERSHLRNAPPLGSINRLRQQLPPKHLKSMSNMRKIGSIYASLASHAEEIREEIDSSMGPATESNHECWDLCFEWEED